MTTNVDILNKAMARTRFNNFFRFIFGVIFWIVILYLLLPLFANLFHAIFGHTLVMNDFIILVTAGFLMATLYETKETNRKAKEKEIRPIILRDGFIYNWSQLNFSIIDNKLQGEPLKFSVLKNIAANISGEIRISGKKYDLLFSHEITRNDEKLAFLPCWKGWIKEGEFIYAIFMSDNSVQDTKVGDGLTVFYSDIEGKRYKTTEDSENVQESKEF